MWWGCQVLGWWVAVVFGRVSGRGGSVDGVSRWRARRDATRGEVEMELRVGGGSRRTPVSMALSCAVRDAARADFNFYSNHTTIATLS